MRNLGRAVLIYGWVALTLPGFASAPFPVGGWFPIPRSRLCVTEGTIEDAAGDRLTVNAPKMRAYVNAWTSQSMQVRFTYLGPTKTESALGAGQMRRQFGLKLHAQDPCNLVYAMWRIDPESKLVVSVKRNPSQHTSAECTNHGYTNIKPQKASAVPHLQSGESHTLRAEMKKQELRVFVDAREVWQGDIGADAARLEGPLGIRSDNVSLEFDLRAGEYEGPHPNYVKACKSGDSD